MAEQEPGQVWRIWVDTKRRIVSFHPVEGFEALEFRPGPGHVFRCVDKYTRHRYRYQ